MGGVWCKADKGQRSYSPKAPFNNAISRWTDHVRQAYRKPKHHHRPPRPPQKPARSNERLAISAPTLLREASSDGWRTATLIVPESQVAPVPPPRKKRKRNVDLSRSAVSMDDLNRGSPDCLSKSTISLPDNCSSDTIDSRGSSSTLVVTPILESRLNLADDGEGAKNKENTIDKLVNQIEEEGEDCIDIVDQPEIIPIEKETLFTTRTLLHSNLGYVDKLSAISEVSAESGFDDKTDVLKYSEESGSVTSVESVPREAGLNILAHIHNIKNVSPLKENCVDLREKTAVSKKEWLQNILKVDPEPYLISGDASKGYRRGSDDVGRSAISEAVTGQPNSLPTDHLHLMNRETQTSATGTVANEPSPSSPEIDPYPDIDKNHSVLLDIIQKSRETEIESKTSNFLDHKEESIFLTNTKTNIIYKSLSSDNLTDDYDTNYSGVAAKTIRSLSESSAKSDSENGGHYSAGEPNQFNGLTSKTHLSDYSFQTPKLVESDSGLNSLLEDKRSNIVSSFDFKEIRSSKNNVTELRSLQSTVKKVILDTEKNNDIKGVEVSLPNNRGSENGLQVIKSNDKPNTKEALAKRDSVSSSRRSSITDSLHEFEMSIYDMLKESKKNDNSSDEEDTLKTVK